MEVVALSTLSHSLSHPDSSCGGCLDYIANDLVGWSQLGVVVEAGVVVLHLFITKLTDGVR